MGMLRGGIWFAVAGVWLWLGWCAVGLFWCATVVGIPVGIQCLRLARLALFPFGKRLRYSRHLGPAWLNLLWLACGGFLLALEALVLGFLLSLTLVGIPFGMRCFRLAGLALAPFGTRVG